MLLIFCLPTAFAIGDIFTGADYTVTIQPDQTPEIPTLVKPQFTTFTITSTTDILEVGYQLDNYVSTGWKKVQSGINAKTWNWPGWSISDEEWSALGQGTHTIYFHFKRKDSPAVGEGGEIYWQFFRGEPLPSAVTLIKPNGGEILNRQPYTITWSLLNPEKVDRVTLRYSRESGSTYPYQIAVLPGPRTSYNWRSPNISTTKARVQVTVRMKDGAEHSDTSDRDFTIRKGYSILTWLPSLQYEQISLSSLQDWIGQQLWPEG